MSCKAHVRQSLFASSLHFRDLKLLTKHCADVDRGGGDNNIKTFKNASLGAIYVKCQMGNWLINLIILDA